MDTLFLCVTIGEKLAERLSQTNVIVGLSLAVLGFALSLLAKRITIFTRKEDKIDDNDKLYIGLKAFGLVMIFVALIILIVE